MNIELAQKLKDAGLPQDNIAMAYSRAINREGWQLETRGMIEQNQNHFCGENFSSPILLELVEACGKGEMVLNIIDGKYTNARFVGKDIYGEGATPEEAVANLYLSLHS